MTEEFAAHRIGTKAIHAGQPPDPISGAVILPISLSTTFQQSSPGVFKGYDYSRSGNPTRQALEENIAALEGGKYGLAFASGLAANTTILSLLSPGDEVISADDVYGGTRRHFTRIFGPGAGVTIKFVDFNKVEQFEAALSPKTKLIWIESPTNPTLKVFDIPEIVKRVKGQGIIVVTDNTFMTPYFQQPLSLGSDIVVHSATKYLNGHSDVVMGVVALNDDALYERLKFLQNGMGTVPSAFDCFLLLRGLKTLHLRMKAHQENALVVAKYLEGHKHVDAVVYPGLASHPQAALVRKQMSGFSGVITFFLKGTITEARKFLEALQLLALAESLGGVESLIESPVIMTHASVPPETRKLLGISDSLIRLSVGVENIEDIIEDLDRGFKNAFPTDGQ
eukprot:TRINITY_DN8523_c0_g1_i1.p1 TRINITY_DN8523_c0_g1~~TRINITY_DN8523_c0_g1_i1.p1  ORF type:complete len:395 (-),score=92.35 TRINITY_DN8523_c0_g1_i1:56-1240(-)